MLKPEILLMEFREMMHNLERKGQKIDIDFESLFNSFLVALKISNKLIIEVLEREVTGFGTGAHVITPQKHLGKKAIMIIINKK